MRSTGGLGAVLLEVNLFSSPPVIAGVILSEATSADTWTAFLLFAEKNLTVCESRPSADGRRMLFVSAGSMIMLVRSHCWSPENSCGRELSVDSKENWSRQSSKTRLPFVRRNARIFPELPGRRDSACHQWQRNPDSLKHKITRIGIGVSLAAEPLPHHPACGSVPGGSGLSQ